MHNQSTENHYMKAYESHYRAQSNELSVKTVENMLTNFIHLQEVMNQNIHDIADILEFVLRKTENQNANEGVSNQLDPQRARQSNGYSEGNQGMQIERNNNSVEKIDRSGQAKPQNGLADNSLVYNEVVIGSENDRRALKAAATYIHNPGQRPSINAYGDNKGVDVPISNPQTTIKNLLVSNQIKSRNLITEATKIPSQQFDRPFAPNRSESDIQIIETNQTDFDFKPPLKPKNVQENYPRHHEMGGLGLPNQQSKSIRSEKHIDLTFNRGLESNENLVNRSHLDNKPSKPIKDTFEQFLFNREKIVFQGRSFIGNQALSMKDNQSVDIRSNNNQVNLKKIKNPSGSYINEELPSCVGCLYVS